MFIVVFNAYPWIERWNIRSEVWRDGVAQPLKGKGVVILTSTYAQEAPGQLKGFDYSRTCNPTRSALEGNLAALEGAKHGLCFSSGMAAINTLYMTMLGAGAHMVAGDAPDLHERSRSDPGSEWHADYGSAVQPGVQQLLLHVPVHAGHDDLSRYARTANCIVRFRLQPG